MNTLLAIETDEFAHRSYDKEDEIKRYNDCFMAFSSKVIWIRFNPDPNRETIKTDLSLKLDTLMATIKEQIRRIENEENKELIEIIHLFQ